MKVIVWEYLQIIKKMKSMAAAKKTNAQMATQAYTIAAKALTKPVVQKVIL